MVTEQNTISLYERRRSCATRFDAIRCVVNNVFVLFFKIKNAITFELSFIYSNTRHWIICAQNLVRQEKNKENNKKFDQYWLSSWTAKYNRSWRCNLSAGRLLMGKGVCSGYLLLLLSLPATIVTAAVPNKAAKVLRAIGMYMITVQVI